MIQKKELDSISSSDISQKSNQEAHIESALSIGKALKRKISREDEFEVITDKKIISESILMSTPRRRIYETLFLYPCINLTAICKELAIKQPSAVWHLKKLSENEFVEEVDFEGRKVYYPKGMIPNEDIPIFSYLNLPNVRSVYRTIVLKPGISRIELTNFLSLKYTIVTNNITKLLKLGFISKIKDGKETRYFPTELIKKREEDFRIRMKGYRELIIKRLDADGLQPKIERRSDSELVLRIVIGLEESFLHIHTRPFATILAKE